MPDDRLRLLESRIHEIEEERAEVRSEWGKWRGAISVEVEHLAREVSDVKDTVKLHTIEIGARLATVERDTHGLSWQIRILLAMIVAILPASLLSAWPQLKAMIHP